MSKRTLSGLRSLGRPAWRRLAVQSAIGLCLLPLSFAWSTWAAPAAAPFVVNSPADLVAVPPLDGSHCAASNAKCTLRAAIMQANHTPGGGATIILPAGTYSLTIPASSPDDETTGDLNISTTVSIHGAGASSTIIDANGGTTQDRAFSIGPGAVVSLNGVTIRGGAAAGPGGGINNAGLLTLANSAVISNTANSPAGFGGGIDNQGQLTVTNSLITGNDANNNGWGGGLENVSGNVIILDSTVTNNHAAINGGGISNGATVSVYSSAIANNTSYNGGGIFDDLGNTTLVATTVSRNTVTNQGGGLEENGGTMNLVNSTISGNNADFDGGGILNSCSCASVVNLYNVTVTNNQADADYNGTGTGGGINNSPSAGNTVNMQNSLIAGNWQTALMVIRVLNDCIGTVTSLDYNLVGYTNGCTFPKSAHDQPDVPASIGPLQDNGGPTLTHALLPGSLAIDAGNSSGCTGPASVPLVTDQRGYPRTANGAGQTRCDIGAFELQRVVNLPLVRR